MPYSPQGGSSLNIRKMYIENQKHKGMKTFSINTNKRFRLRGIGGILLLLMLVALPMSAQNVSVEAKIDSTVIFIGQQT